MNVSSEGSPLNTDAVMTIGQLGSYDREFYLKSGDIDNFMYVSRALTINEIYAFSGLETEDNSITSCGTISSGGYYVLTQNISSSGTCLTISADNVTIDCDDYNITFGGASNWGIVSYSGNNNLTVQNCNVYQNGTDSSAIAIQLDSANNITVQNSYVDVYGYGLYFYQADNLNILNNEIISEVSNSITIQELDNVIVSNNDVNNIIVFTDCDNATVNYNNVITDGTNERGIRFIETNNGNISYNNITTTGSSSHGIYLLQFNDNKTNNNNWIGYNWINVSDSSSNGIFLWEYTSWSGIYQKNFITQNTIVDNGFTQLKVSGYNNQTEIKNQNVLDYDFSNALISFENSSYGLVNYTSVLTVTGNNLIGYADSDIVFGNASVWVNSSVSGFNKSANITLYDVGDRGFVEPVILKDGVECLDCVNYTSLTATNVLFSVTGFSNYSIGEGYEEVVVVPTGAFGFDITGATSEFVNVVYLLIPLIFLIILILVYRDIVKEQLNGLFRK